MTNNSTKIGMKKIKRNKESGPGTIIKKIKTTFVECIRLGRKKIWIKGAPSGENITGGNEFGILTWIKKIMKSTDHAFSRKRKYITERKWV